MLAVISYSYLRVSEKKQQNQQYEPNLICLLFLAVRHLQTYILIS